MFAFLKEYSLPVLVIGTILAIALFTICIIRKFIRLAIGIAVMSIVIPILFTIFWGDGSAYISELASYLDPKHQQQLEEAYAYYKKRDAEDQTIDYDAVSNKITDVFGSIQEKEREVIQETTDYFRKQGNEWGPWTPIFEQSNKADPEP